MKTIFDFLKEQNGSDTFLRHNQDEYVRLKDAQEAGKQYASQAIDRCAEVHRQLKEAANPVRSEESIYSAMKGFVKQELK